MCVCDCVWESVSLCVSVMTFFKYVFCPLGTNLMDWIMNSMSASILRMPTSFKRKHFHSTPWMNVLNFHSAFLFNLKHCHEILPKLSKFSAMYLSGNLNIYDWYFQFFFNPAIEDIVVGILVNPDKKKKIVAKLFLMSPYKAIQNIIKGLRFWAPSKSWYPMVAVMIKVTVSIPKK